MRTRMLQKPSNSLRVSNMWLPHKSQKGNRRNISPSKIWLPLSTEVAFLPSTQEAEGHEFKANLGCIGSSRPIWTMCLQKKGKPNYIQWLSHRPWALCLTGMGWPTPLLGTYPTEVIMRGKESNSTFEVEKCVPPSPWTNVKNWGLSGRLPETCKFQVWKTNGMERCPNGVSKDEDTQFPRIPERAPLSYGRSCQALSAKDSKGYITSLALFNSMLQCKSTR